MALCGMYLEKQRSFRGQEVANLAWGLSKLRHKDVRVMVAIAEQVWTWVWGVDMGVDGFACHGRSRSQSMCMCMYGWMDGTS